jgi:hypothetical protein
MDTTRNPVSRQRRRAGAAAAVVVLIVLAVAVWQTWDYWRPEDSTAVARGPGGDAGPPPPPPGGFGGPPSAQDARRRFHEQIKSSLGAGDEEWAKLRPGIEKVTQLQDQLRPPTGVGPGMGPPGMGVGPGMGMGPGAGRGPGSQPAGEPGAPGGSGFAKKSEMLRAAVADKETSPAALAANLAAAREERKQVQAELKAAQEDLRKLLTPKQEAVLTVQGVLD